MNNTIYCIYPHSLDLNLYLVMYMVINKKFETHICHVHLCHMHKSYIAKILIGFVFLVSWTAVLVIYHLVSHLTLNVFYFRISYSSNKEDSLEKATIDAKKSTNYLGFNVVLLAGLAIACYSIQFFFTNSNQNQIIYDESKFYSDVGNLGKKYNVNYNSILQIKSGKNIDFNVKRFQ